MPDWISTHGSPAWLAIAALLAFTARAGWHDFRTGRIPNSLLKGMLLSVVLWLWVLVLTTGFLDLAPELLVPARTVPAHLVLVLRNGLTAFALGLALWLGRLWAAGDAKLFPLMVMLLPVNATPDRYVATFPGFVLFYNIIIASLLVVFVDFVAQLSRHVLAFLARSRGRRASITEEAPPLPFAARAWAFVRANAADWGRFALMLLVAFIFIRLLRHFLREGVEFLVHLDDTVLYVALFFLCHPIIRLMRIRPVFLGAVALVVVFLVIAAFEWIPGVTLRSMLLMTGMAFFLLVFRMVYDAYQRKVDFVVVAPDDLQAKMILAEETMDRLVRDRAYFEEQGAALGTLLPDGLSAAQVPLVKRWLRERNPGTPVYVQKTFPMAPSMFIGLVLTLIFQDYAVMLPR